jgi:hypothetical protein
VQQALVIKHAALERLAAEIGITFDKPEVLRAEADECVLLVHGKLGEAQEWSIGEAKIGLNYQVSGKQAGYPYAMSEKRAKDRVILKLAKLHGAYSEDEADDFKPQTASAQPLKNYGQLEALMTDCTTIANLMGVPIRFAADIEALTPFDREALKRVYKFKHEALKKFGEAA